MKKKLAISLISACSLAGWSSAAQAATATGNLNVLITITDECVINAEHTGNAVLDFGSKGLLKSNQDHATGASSSAGAFDVTCNKGVVYSVGLDAGQHASTAGDISTRRMRGVRDDNEFVAYQLYQDAARTIVWGNTTGTAGNVVSRTADGSTQVIPIYGRVPPQDTPKAGAYNDLVAITVTY